MINKIKIKLQEINWVKYKDQFLEIVSKDYFMESIFPSITKYYLTKGRS